jgi:hypothetical protein
MPKRIRRKELKGPDEFVSLTQRALQYAKENDRELTIAGLALVAVVGLALGVRAYRGWQQSKAEDAFAQAYEEFVAGHLDGAVAAFSTINARWPRTQYAQLSLLYLANSYSDLGKDSDAEIAFSQLLSHSRDDALRQIAYYNLGMLRRKAGDAAAAQEKFRAAGALEGPLQATALFTALRTQSDPAKAADIASGDLQSLRDGLPPQVREYLESRRAAASTGK